MQKEDNTNRDDNASSGRKKKLLYRRCVGIKTLEAYGIKRGDTAIVVMDGNIQLDELGYFQINHGGQDYDQFRFLCEQDRTCFEWIKDESSLCLRTSKAECEGSHEGTPYGRVVSIERSGQTVETELIFRPFDERESLLLREQNQIGEMVNKPTTAPSKKKTGRTLSLRHRISSFDWPYYGVHRGDRLTVEENAQAPTGKLVLFKRTTKKGYFFSRVCLVKSDTVRICSTASDTQHSEPHDIPLANVIGPVTNIDHEDCVWTKITKLRRRIEELKDEYDAICNTSRIAELENEIYQLEIHYHSPPV
jgi:hypothetical protein